MTDAEVIEALERAVRTAFSVITAGRVYHEHVEIEYITWEGKPAIKVSGDSTDKMQPGKVEMVMV